MWKIGSLIGALLSERPDAVADLLDRLEADLQGALVGGFRAAELEREDRVPLLRMIVADPLAVAEALDGAPDQERAQVGQHAGASDEWLAAARFSQRHGAAVGEEQGHTGWIFGDTDDLLAADQAVGVLDRAAPLAVDLDDREAVSRAEIFLLELANEIDE